MKDFIHRKRDVEKEADGGIGHPFADELWQKHQMIIMDPNDVIIFGNPHYGIAKEFVDAFIGLIKGLVIHDILGEIVKQGPDGLIAKTVIVVLYVAL